MMPSLSVDQGVALRRRKEAPADSSPPKQMEESKRPGANHLKPTGVSRSLRFASLTTRSIMLELTTVFPMAAEGDQRGRLARRYWMATAR